MSSSRTTQARKRRLSLRWRAGMKYRSTVSTTCALGTWTPHSHPHPTHTPLTSDISNLAHQYQTHHHLPLPLLLVTILQTLYVLDFFINESWYLRTIDIAHDHYGFYLAWGCFCFLPTTYTLQAQYLGSLAPTTPSPSPITLAPVFALGLAGYALFRSVNAQKDVARRTGGRCRIWGAPAVVIRAPYATADGARHESVLLCSGWWGRARHANYVGDLLLSGAMCGLAGTGRVVVWFYAGFMAVLLVHRCVRDERRGREKYGAAWEEYCGRVPWRLVPGVW
ncbi:7-dehydrocholesterol reductase [Diplodia seriata]|uniref:7-dehydrocholesterol reductase n=1 Tax=Diplodia seriata TaxID=420778 RepID=A0A1S8BQ03_9PEZI|nr:7-dehydrocholesterol reductase [Diplodia seriata]